MADSNNKGHHSSHAAATMMMTDEVEEEVEEEESRVTAHTYGALETSRAASDCWLIRLPPAIADVWDSVPEGTELGELVFCKGGGNINNGSAAATSNNSNSKPSITVHVNEHLLDTAKQHRRGQHQGKSSSAAATSATSTKNKPLPGVLPLHYGLQAMTKKVPTMHPFSRNPSNGSVKIWGVVSRTANLQVTQDVQYRALLKDRLVTSNITGNRYVKPVEASESIMSHNPAAAGSSSSGSGSAVAAASSTDPVATAPTSSSSISHPGNNPNLSSSAAEKKSFGNAISRIGKRLLEANEMAQSSATNSPGVMAAMQGNNNNKRARQFAPDQPLRSVVFELFQVQERWAVKDLRMAAVSGGAALANAKRAEADIRDILRDIGEYHRSGDYKNLWELKREFQTQSGQATGDSGPSGSGGAASSSSSTSPTAG